MTFPEYEKFAADSALYLAARNSRVETEFGIGNLPRYEYDLFRRELWWGEIGAPKFRARATIVGSHSATSSTWLWSWANPHFSDVPLGEIEKVRAFGEAEAITKLTEQQWPADEFDGWEMTAIAARLLESQGAYRSPSGNGFLYLLYDNLELIPSAEMAHYMPLKRPEA